MEGKKDKENHYFNSVLHTSSSEYVLTNKIAVLCSLTFEISAALG